MGFSLHKKIQVVHVILEVTDLCVCPWAPFLIWYPAFMGIIGFHCVLCNIVHQSLSIAKLTALERHVACSVNCPSVELNIAGTQAAYVFTLFSKVLKAGH